MQMDVQFQFQPDAVNSIAIITSKSVYYDGFSKDRLMGVVQKVTDGTLLVAWKFQKKFGSPAPKQEQMYT